MLMTVVVTLVFPFAVALHVSRSYAAGGWRLAGAHGIVITAILLVLAAFRPLLSFRSEAPHAAGTRTLFVAIAACVITLAVGALGRARVPGWLRVAVATWLGAITTVAGWWSQ